jgi:hypothetical protein
MIVKGCPKCESLRGGAVPRLTPGCPKGECPRGRARFAP